MKMCSVRGEKEDCSRDEIWDEIGESRRSGSLFC